MSRRRKGPAWPPHQQHNPFPAPAPPHPQSQGCPCTPSPQTRDLPSLRGAPSEPVLVSVYLSVPPARVQPWDLDRAGAAAATGSLSPPTLPPPHPIPSTMCADVACSICF